MRRRAMHMPDVHRVIITVDKPSLDGTDPGAVSEGFYKVECGIVIMTDQDGAPIMKAGREWHAPAEPGHEHVIAGRLAREIRRAFGLDRRDTFGRAIRYSPIGLA